MPAVPRTRVSRERVLRAAVDLADMSGIDAVSMRNVAAELGVVPMALYKHVADKEDLLSGMIDLLIAEYDPAGTGEPWRDALRTRILSARSVLSRHQWARAVIETRRTRTPAVLEYMNDMTGLFLEGGFSADLTHHAMHALGHRIWGFSPEAFEDDDALPVPDDPALRAQMIEQVRAVYPHILTIALASSDGDDVTAGRCDEDFEFAFTLDLLLDAFERLRDAGWSSR
ncbi:TetR/AcrR family transcriptional regulator [Microbacterium sp. EST19A]|uniref:TetR/AcrR family transcriptional regulator n=1 Tax=Microbacterium sp. EST19A TaxID=2862681 RepID=UPI001CBE4BD1|nr:TetR/AcrR family transcriptional regulator C-terminal domain-containing protein [Microbacterium sp. EST19A]